MPRLKISKNLILACHITGIYDVNRSNTLPNDDYLLIKDWAESIADLKLNGIVFHNGFSEETCQKHQNKHLQFVKIDHDERFNPNVYRYLVYQDFLQNYAHLIENIFLNDVSDVVLAKNPFAETLYLENPDAIFCGDEPKTLNNDWMLAHAEHLRSKIDDYQEYEEKFGQETLLNCGIIGGNIKIMSDFVEKLANIHRQHNHDNRTAFTGDMGAFNYLVRTKFNDRVFHGSPVNTVFKAYENERTDCWFRHK